MARPKKIPDSVAVRLVDELYEQCGDPKQLKFSALETYAASVGVDAKAYDLRRNRAVILRIAEIEAMSENFDVLGALAYKDLDIDGFLETNKSPAKLKKALAELDGRWRKLYGYAVAITAEKKDLAAKLAVAGVQIVELSENCAELSDLRKTANALRTENAYLRKMIREYLYPALAVEILQTPGAERLTTITEHAVLAMTDGDVPEAFNVSIAADQDLRSREDILLERLRLLAQREML
jgi:hypothetical protein